MSKYIRQLDLINQEELKFPIHIIGAGGIGSWTTLLLAKMGCSNITVYDFDNVEEHNTASQFYKDNQLGKLKTESLMKNVLEQTGIKIKTDIPEHEQYIKEGLIIIAVDTMQMRIDLNEMFKDKDCYIIDARMGGLQLEIYNQPADKYQSTLVAIDKVDQDPCTGRAISFNCAVIGGLITNLVRLFVNKKLKDGEFTFLFDNLISISKYDTKQTNTIS